MCTVYIYLCVCINCTCIHTHRVPDTHIHTHTHTHIFEDFYTESPAAFGNLLILYGYWRLLETLHDFINSFQENRQELISFFIEAVYKFFLKYLRNYYVKKFVIFKRSFTKRWFKLIYRIKYEVHYLVRLSLGTQEKEKKYVALLCIKKHVHTPISLFMKNNK
jgi:hypothetical protein